MALAELLHCMPLRVLMVFTHVYFIGFLSSGGKIITSLLGSSSTTARFHLQSHRSLSTTPTIAPLNLTTRSFLLRKALQDARLTPTSQAVPQAVPTGPKPGTEPLVAGVASKQNAPIPQPPAAAAPAIPAMHRLLQVPRLLTAVHLRGALSALQDAPAKGAGSVTPAEAQGKPTTPAAVPVAAVAAAAAAAAAVPVTDCERLDAELTGLRCYQAADPQLQEKCRRLQSCNAVNPNTADIEKQFLLAGPSCTKQFFGPPGGPQNRWMWKCSLLQAP
eukprot:EG_transcript_23710